MDIGALLVLESTNYFFTTESIMGVPLITKNKVVGVVKDNELSVTVNGKTPRRDENGNFYLDIRLQDGPNDVAVTVGDSSGNQSTLTRRIIYRP